MALTRFCKLIGISGSSIFLHVLFITYKAAKQIVG